MLGFLALPGALMGGVSRFLDRWGIGGWGPPFLDRIATKTLGFLAMPKLDPGFKGKQGCFVRPQLEYAAPI